MTRIALAPIIWLWCGWARADQGEGSMLQALTELLSAGIDLVMILCVVGGLTTMLAGLKHAYDYFRSDGGRGGLWGGAATIIIGLLLIFLVNVLSHLTGSTLFHIGALSNYVAMSSDLQDALDYALGTDVTEVLMDLWAALAVLCILIGCISCVHALHSLGKRFKYDNPQYGEGKALLFVFGWLLINITPIINYTGARLRDWL